MTLEKELAKQRQEAETSLRQEEARVRGEVRRESETARGQLNRRRGNLLEQTQQAKSAVRRAETLEQRKADLPLTKPKDLGTKKALESIAEQARDIEKDIDKLEAKINYAEAEALADIERQVAEKRAELDTLYQQGLDEIKKWKAGHIQVKDDWITKDDWDRLDKKSQSKLKELGIDGYNQWTKDEVARYEREYQEAVAKAEREQKEWEANHIELKYINPDTGEHEWVSKEEWDSLTSPDQKLLSIWGIESFNVHKKGMAINQVGIGIIDTARFNAFKRDYIQVGDEWIAKSDYDKLTSEQKVVINQLGVNRFNARMMVDQAINQAYEVMLNDRRAAKVAFASTLSDPKVNAQLYNQIEKTLGMTRKEFSDAITNRTMTDEWFNQLWSAMDNTERLMVYQKFQPTESPKEMWTRVGENIADFVTFGVYGTVTNWGEMDNTERGLNIALSALLIGSLAARPILSATRNYLTTTLGETRYTAISRSLKGLRGAIEAGDVEGIKNACAELRTYGRLLNEDGKVIGSTTGKLTGDRLISQANWFERNADILATKKVYPKPAIIARLKEAEKTIKGFIEPKARPGAFALSKEASRKIRELKVAGRSKKVEVHPMTRQEFNKATRNLTPAQRNYVDNMVGASKEQVVKKINDFNRTNKVWDEANRVAENARIRQEYANARAGAGKTPVKVERPSPHKGFQEPRVSGKKAELSREAASKEAQKYKPSYDPETKSWSRSTSQTAEEANESLDLMARQWIEQNRTWGAKRIAEKIAGMTRERQARMTKFFEEILGKGKGREVAKLLEDMEKSKTARLKRMIREEAQQRLNELLREFTTTGKGATKALKGVMDAGLLSYLLATNARLGVMLLNQANSQARGQALAKADALGLLKAETLGLSKAETKGLTKAETLGLIKDETKLEAAAQTALQTKVELKVDELIKTEPLAKQSEITDINIDDFTPKKIKPTEPKKPPREPEKPKAKKRYYIDSDDNLIADDKKITKEQLKASVAWKQGFIYKLIYPPYGKKNIINTREPIPGVKYHAGPESAYRSLTQIKKGELPPVIRRDMGIMDIEITAGHTTLGGKKTKPKIKFRQDKRQATKTTPVVGGVR